MDLPVNRFKHGLAAGRLQLGLWSSLASTVAAEVVADSGYDWILLDAEHSPNEIPGLMAQMQAMGGGTATPIVRPPWNDPVMVKRVLDIGAQSVLLPFVQNAEEARAAVASTRYPPKGIRGVAGSTRATRYGRVAGYLEAAERELCVLLQVETMEAMTNLEAIATVDGVDGVFIGPNDLAASMGYLGKAAAPAVQDAIRDAVTRLRAIGKPAGILVTNEDDARRCIEWGYLFVAIGSDAGLLAKSADALLRRFR